MSRITAMWRVWERFDERKAFDTARVKDAISGEVLREGAVNVLKVYDMVGKWIIQLSGRELIEPPVYKRDGERLTVEEASAIIRKIEQRLTTDSIEEMMAAEGAIRRIMEHHGLRGKYDGEL